MAKLTKQEIDKHKKVMDLIKSDKPLTFDQKWFILENYHEGATNINSLSGAFFTPVYLARDFALEIFGSTVVDLCAGIGGLSFFAVNKYDPNECPKEIVCVELNHDYIEVGKRVVPEATWIHSDVLAYKPEIIFEQSISNPPFGKIKTSDQESLKYKGSEFEYKVIEKASTISKYGSFILPQGSSGFKYSGTNYYERCEMQKYKKFNKETSIEILPGIGIDTSIYKDEWKGVSVITEIGNVYFTDDYK